MNKYIGSILAGLSIVGLTACNDYLNQEPKDKLIPETYFNSAANLKAYTLNFYTMLPSHSDNVYELGTFSADNGTDNQAYRSASTIWVPGEWRVGDETQNWDFRSIRQINYFLENAEPAIEAGEVTGSELEIKQALGEAYFFRAYAYWNMYSAIGDMPITDEVYPDDKELLLEKSVRYPRHKVAHHILDDLTKAVNNLPEASTYGKNGLTKDCANLFRSRVALFEGTWLKYHKGTALVPGGPGWPGDTKMLDGFDIENEISYFLGEAKASAKIVADKQVELLVENTDTPEGMDLGMRPANPYYLMFSADNSGEYDEVLMYRAYNLTTGPTTQMQAQFQKNAGGTGWTRGMVNSFLMRNGLPIYAAGSGYDPAWENDGVAATIQGRDSRLTIFTKDDNSIITYGLDGNSPAKYRMSWLFSADNTTRCPTGYAVKKGQGYDYAQAQGNLQSHTGSITFRGAEALLNYMEASVEASSNDATVDADAQKYWQALRRRAKVDPDYVKTINATDMNKEAEGDWGAYSHGQLINPTLYNIRRERRNELCAEGLRMMDLRRWSALDQMITTPYIIEGIKYWGTVYCDPNSPLAMRNEDGEFIEPIVSPDDGKGNMSPETSPYVRPYQITKLQNFVFDGYTFTLAHYLSPIGANVFVYSSPDLDPETSVVYQNPGWSKRGGTGATTIQ